MNDFGQRLFQYRRQAGMSQEELAEKVEVSRQTLSKWETGQSYPDAEKMVSVCNVLSVSPNELLNCYKENKVNSEPKREKSNNQDWVYDLFWVIMFACGYGLFVAPFFAIATPANWVIILGMVMMVVPTVFFVMKGINRVVRKIRNRK